MNHVVRIKRVDVTATSPFPTQPHNVSMVDAMEVLSATLTQARSVIFMTAISYRAEF